MEAAVCNLEKKWEREKIKQEKRNKKAIALTQEKQCKDISKITGRNCTEISIYKSAVLWCRPW